MNINYDYTQSLGPIIGIPLIMILYNDNRNRSESRRCVTGGSQSKVDFLWPTFAAPSNWRPSGDMSRSRCDISQRTWRNGLGIFKHFLFFFQTGRYWSWKIYDRNMADISGAVSVSDIACPAGLAWCAAASLGVPWLPNVRFEWKNGWSWSEIVWDLGW